MTDGPRTVLLDLAAAVGAGQETRAREFVRLVRCFDPESRFVVVKQAGRLDTIDWSSLRGAISETPVFAGRWAGARRMAWQNRHMRRIVESERVDAYVTFSHFLPAGIDTPVRVVGVSNLAPFSRAAWDVSAPDERLRLFLLRRSILRSAQRATVVLALSRECRRLLVAGGVAPERIRVTSNGADWSESPCAREPGADARFVLCVSHFYAYKNLETLVDGFARLDSVARADHELLIVGPPVDRRYFRRIADRAAASGAPIRIVPGVPRSELSALYRRCTVFAFPSLVENSPNALLEAMAHGAPCLVCSEPPMPEFGGDAVRYFAPRDAHSLSAALSRMLREPEECCRLGALARNRALAYRWEDLVRATVDAYRPDTEGSRIEREINAR